MHCSSPRESAGLKMLEASIAPSAAPAPTMVCSSSMNRMTFLERLISSITALMRSSNWPRYFVPATMSARSSVMTFLSIEDLGHDAAGDLLRQALDDGGLAHAGLADEHRVVLGAAAENLDDAADLRLAAHDGIEFALARQFGEVAAEGLERGRLDLLLVLGPAAAAGDGAAASSPPPSPENCGSSSRRISWRVRSMSTSSDLEHARGHALALAEQAEQNVLGADVAVVERLRLLAGQRQHLLHARRVGNAAGRLGLRAGADLLLDGGAHGLQVEPHLLEHADRDPLPELDQAEQDVLRADVVVVEAVGFLAGQRQHLLRAGREIVHWFHESR